MRVTAIDWSQDRHVREGYLGSPRVRTSLPQVTAHIQCVAVSDRDLEGLQLLMRALESRREVTIGINAYGGVLTRVVDVGTEAPGAEAEIRRLTGLLDAERQRSARLQEQLRSSEAMRRELAAAPILPGFLPSVAGGGVKQPEKKKEVEKLNPGLLEVL